MNREESAAQPIKLSDRLLAIASLVRGGEILCDVGCDHAHIPIYLLQHGQVKGVLGMDVIPGPLEKARENLERYGCSRDVTLRQSDGLDAYRIGEAQSLLISGMGGKIIRTILLREEEKTKSFSELILQPQADAHLVRAAVRTLGFVIDDERILRERGKYYVILHAVQGSHQPSILSQETQNAFGPVLLRRRDPLLHKYLLWQEDVQNRILCSVRQVQTPSEETAKSEEAARRQLEMIEEALSWYAEESRGEEMP